MKTRSVLIVDDDDYLRRTMTTVLSREGLEIAEAASGEGAAIKADAGAFGLIGGRGAAGGRGGRGCAGRARSRDRRRRRGGSGGGLARGRPGSRTARRGG